MESVNDAARELLSKREELSIERQAIADTRALLSRVEEQQRANPEDEARWKKRADFLQDALNDSHKRIAGIQAAIEEIQSRLGTSAASVPEPIAPVSRDPDIALTEHQRLGAERVMGAPVFKLEALPLEDYALARSFLAAPDAVAWPRDRREELRRRIAIYDRRAERDRLQSRPRMSIEERRQQMLLRNVLDKCRAQAHSTLTLGEIDLLIHSCDLLVQNHASFEQGDRLFDLVNRAVDEICQRWAKLETIRDALKPES